MKMENGKLKKYKLGEICDLNLSSLKSSDRIDEILYLDTSNITENRISDLQSFSIANAPSRAQRKVRNNTIIFSTVRPNQNHFGIIKNSQSNLIVSSGFTTLDIKNPEDFDANYVYLKLTQPYVVNYLQTLAQNSVSAYPSINPDDIGNLSFYFPPLESQQKIAAVLSTLDDKIALNRRMNAKLEQMAKRLYDHWFVQFDFPVSCHSELVSESHSEEMLNQVQHDECTKPYKSSGGKMVWNETLKREIPAGWEVKKIDDFCRIFTGKKDVNQSLNSGKYKFYSCAPGYKFSDEKIFEGKAILISGNGSYTGRTIFVNEAFDLYQRTYAVVLKDNLTNWLEYIFFTVQRFLAPKVGGGTHGSAIPYIVYDDIAKESFAFSEEIVAEFEKIIIPILSEIVAKEKEIQKLTALRDHLLPLLMNGQVEVK